MPVEEVAPGEEEIIVRGYRIAPTDQTTGFAETVEVAEKAKSASTVSDVLSDTAGVQVRRLGGLGSYGAASIRGSTPNQVPVYLDDMLINSGGFSAVDLGQFSLETMERVEIYRGSAPVSLSTSGIGGAVSLKTRAFDQPLSETALGYGSWNTTRLLHLRADRLGPVDALFLFTAQRSDGDFEYLNRNGTLFDESDDRIQRRRNNAHLAYGGLLKLDGPIGQWRWTVANDLHARWHGLPGIENIPTREAQLRDFRDALQLRFEGPVWSDAMLWLGGGYLALRDDFEDTQNEIGIGFQHTLSRNDAFNAAVGLEVEHSPEHLSTLRLDGRFERFGYLEKVSEVGPDPQTRIIAAVGAEHQWRPVGEWVLAPALRGELHHARFGGGEVPWSFDDLPAKAIDDFFLSPSMGTRWEAVTGLVLRANVGRYLRTPDVTELFGDRGMVVGNPELEPEAGINADAGATYLLERQGILTSMRCDAAWFGSWVSDLIAYVQNSQHTVRPENVDAAEILGLESSLRFVFGDLILLQGNYTYLHGVNRSDKPYHQGRHLPGRPAHEAFGKIEARDTMERWGGGLWFEMDYAGSNYLDQANLKEDALARLLLGLGARLERPREGLTLTVEVKNLLDTITVRDALGRRRPMRDFEAFPLPGRTITATLHWRLP